MITARLLDALRPALAPMAASICARIVHLLVDLALVAAAAWGAAALALDRDVALGWLLAGLTVGAILKALARYAEQLMGHEVAFGLLSSMRIDFFRRAAPLAPAALDDPTGDLVDRAMSDVDRVEVFYAHTVAPVVAGAVVPLLTVVGVSLWAHPALGLALLPFMLTVGWVSPWVSSRAASRWAGRAGVATGALAAHVSDGIQGLGDVVVFGYGDRRVDELGTRSEAVAAAEAAMARIDGARSAVNDLLIGAALVTVAFLGVGMLDDGRLQMPVLAGVLAVALVGFVPLRDVQEVAPLFDRARAAAGRIFAITDRPPAVGDPAQPQAPAERPVLSFEGVDFSYPEGGRGVHGIDLAVGPGERVAVVGPSGSGKSTLAALAIRFRDPDSGRVTLGGRDLRHLTLADVRRSVAVVSQQSHLFAGTVADNLRLGRPEASPAEMEEAARIAAVADDVARLPDSYDGQVGELGTRLSGGQRDRISLARGVLADTPVLVLDEITSDLDVDTEARVMHNLAGMSGDRAVLMIAHRLTTVVDADEIVVMDRGRIVERGRHADLVALGGLYARLWRRQLDEL